MPLTFLFDLDGTIVDTDEIYTDVWREILKPHSIFVDEHFFCKNIQGKSDEHVVQELIPSSNVKDVSKQKDSLFLKNIQNKKIKIIQGVIEFIKKAYANQIRMAVVTNCNRAIAETILSSLNIINYFEIIIIGNECNHSKPYPDPYIDAYKFLNIDKMNCIVFEDSNSGIQSAISSGVSCVIGIESMYSSSQLLKYGCDFTISHYRDFTYIINQINLYQTKNIECVSSLLSRCKLALEKEGLPVIHLELDRAKLKGGFIASVYRIFLYYDTYDLKEYPKTIILKHEVTNENSFNQIATSLDLYNREYYFYENISKDIAIKCPKYYGTLYSRNNQIKEGIIIEDYDTERFVLNPDFNKDVLYSVVQQCSKYHIQYWNNDMLLKRHNDKTFKPSWQNFLKSRWDTFKKRWCKKDNHKRMCKYILNHFEKIQDYLSSGDITLCHGDVKLPNLFLEKESNEPCFIDWQYIVNGKGVQDVVFFMIESLDIDCQRMYEDDIKEYYYKCISSSVDYSKETFELDWKYAVCHFPFYVCLWFGSASDEELIDSSFPGRIIPRFLDTIERNHCIDFIH